MVILWNFMLTLINILNIYNLHNLEKNSKIFRPIIFIAPPLETHH